MPAARELVAGWGLLVALSAGTVLVTATDVSGAQRSFASACVLVLAGLKARIILSRYLGLKNSRFWMRAFDGAIGLFLVAAFCVYALASGG